MRLGEVALEKRFVTREQLDAALERQRELRVPLGEVLVEMGFITPSQVAAILKYQSAQKILGESGTSGDSLLGETLGGCLIVEKIGAGAMGRAYKAHHLKLDRDVCVKVLHPELCKDRRTKARFTREARSAAKLDHAGIVSVYDFDEVGPYTFIVMQYVDGKSLKDVLEERGPVGPKRAVFVGARLAEALACAHAQKIVHRDVKPANVLVSKQGHIKLTDFGLVRVIEQKGDDGTAKSAVGELVGSPSYMSPEQAQAEPEIDGRSDVYSLAVLIYELASGKLPFEAKQLVSLLKKHLLEPFPSLRAISADCPPELDALLQRLARKSPSERPDAAQAARELRALYKTAFGAEPPSDVTGPPTLGGRSAPTPPAAKPGTRAFADMPTGYYDARDVMEAAIDKLVARALSGQSAQAAKDTRRLQPLAAREAALRILTGLTGQDRHGEVVAAREALLESVKDSAKGLLEIARAHVAVGKSAEAEPIFAQAVLLAPEDVGATLELAQLRVAVGKKDEARAGLDALASRSQGDAPTLAKVAELRWVVLGDPEGATSLYARAAEVAPGSVEARLQLVRLLLDLGRAPEAVKAAEDAIARQPGSAEAHELLGRARRAKGDARGAQAALRRAVELEPRAHSARLVLIEDARAAGQWTEASRLAQEGLGADPRNRELQFELARAREVMGDSAAAARLYANIVEQQPAHSAAQAALERLRKRSS
jgi:tRNA A-37 threonylcarbamoyl transferase component Bud32/tetratricopeptide (TPR) repeat protein